MKPMASDRPFLILLAVVLAVAVLLAISVATPFGVSAYLANAIGQLAAGPIHGQESRTVAPLEWALRDLRRREDIVEFIEAHDLTV